MKLEEALQRLDELIAYHESMRDKHEIARVGLEALRDEIEEKGGEK